MSNHYEKENEESDSRFIDFCLFVCLGADPNILFDTLGTNSISDENVNISRHSTTGI